MKRKHSVCAIILIVAIVGIILSCSNNPTLENKLEETGYVSFGNANSRSLSVMYEMEDFDDLYWFYTATKADRYGQTGQTNGEAPVPAKANGKGIGDGTVGPFSMGDWDFNLYAYKDAGKTIKVYEGKTPSRVNIVAGDTKNISVAVSPYGTTGVLKIENAYFKWDSTSGGDLPVIHLTLDRDKSVEGFDKEYSIIPTVNENNDIVFALNETVSVGFYYCKLWATIDTAETPIYETEEFTLRIYGATTTTIFGDITEQTGPSVRFSATKSDNSELTLITGTETTIVEVNATPTGDNKTTVDFGTYNVGTSSTIGDDGNTTEVSHSLEVAVSSSDTVDTTDEKRFIVDSGRNAVAALDLTLIKTTKVTDTEGNETTTTEPVTTFGEGNEVTITTFIEKNLFDVKVRYNNGTNTPEEITPESYSQETGELVFKVSHFSEYYVVAKLPEARIGSVYYETFDDAWNAATEGSIIEIENDVVFDSSFEMNKKNITINGNGYRFVASDSYYYTTEPAYNMYLANTSGSEGLVFNNIVFDGNNKTYSLIGSGKDKTFNNCVFKNSLNGHYYGVSNGYLKFKDCEFYCNMYNVNQSSGGCVVSFEDCVLSGWNSFGTTETVSFTRTTFTKVPENWYSIVRTYSNTTLTDCSFTEEFVEHEDNTYGCGINPVQKSVAELNDCVVIDSEGNISARYSLSDACKPFVGEEDLLDMGLCIIDGQKNGEKYCSGTIVGDNRLIGNVISEDAYASVNDNGTYTVSSLPVDEDGTYLINDANDLVLFEKLVNERGNSFNSKTVKLAANIDLTGVEWKPIGQTGKTEFKGVFDGQGYTISNMTVNNTDISANCSSGFFGWIENHGEGIVIKDTKFDNAHVEGNHNVGVVAGYIYGKIDGCEVSNSTIIAHNANEDANGDKVGGIAGYVGEDAFIDNNKVVNCEINGNRDIGGIAGAVAGGVDSFQNNSVSDTDVSYVTDGMSNGVPYSSAGAIVSGRTGYVPDDTNTATNVVVGKEFSASTDEELSAALSSTVNEGEPIIVKLNSGSFTLPNGSWKNKNIKFVGSDEGTELNILPPNATAQYGATLVFENMTIKAQTSGDFGGLTHTNTVTYNNCRILGKITLYAGTEEFINCTFENKNDYAIWTWGGKVVNLTGCTFYSGGKAVLLYGGAGSSETPTTVLTVTNCVFNDDNTLDTDKAAIEIGNDYNATYTLIVNNATVNGFADGKNTGSKLWANKNGMDAEHLSVTVDNKEVL